MLSLARNKFDVDEELTQEFNWSYYKRLGAYIKPYRKQVWKILSVIIVANLCAMLGPYFTKIAIDQISPNDHISLLVWIGGFYLVAVAGMGWCLRYRF